MTIEKKWSKRAVSVIAVMLVLLRFRARASALFMIGRYEQTGIGDVLAITKSRIRLSI